MSRSTSALWPAFALLVLGSCSGDPRQAPRVPVAVVAPTVTPAVPPSTKGVPSAVKTPAENLAIIETQDPAPSRELVASFDTLLTRIANRCPEGKERLSDILVNAQTILRKDGYERSLRQLGEMLLSSLPDAGRVPSTCQEVMAVDLLSIEQGME